MTCSCYIGGNGVTEPVEAEHTQECVAESELSEREAPEGEWLSDCCNCQAIGELIDTAAKVYAAKGWDAAVAWVDTLPVEARYLATSGINACQVGMQAVLTKQLERVA